MLHYTVFVLQYSVVAEIFYVNKANRQIISRVTTTAALPPSPRLLIILAKFNNEFKKNSIFAEIWEELLRLIMAKKEQVWLFPTL